MYFSNASIVRREELAPQARDMLVTAAAPRGVEKRPDFSPESSSMNIDVEIACVPLPIFARSNRDIWKADNLVSTHGDLQSYDFSPSLIWLELRPCGSDCNLGCVNHFQLRPIKSSRRSRFLRCDRSLGLIFGCNRLHRHEAIAQYGHIVGLR